jgi:hypothetical protein
MLERVAYQKTDSGQFRPRASLGILYLFGFFFLFAFLLVAPTLWHVLKTTPVSPEQEELAKQAARQAMSLPRLLIALGLAAGVTLVGGRLRLLPGTR